MPQTPAIHQRELVRRLAANLSRARDEVGVTTQQLAKACGIEEEVLRALETASGEDVPPRSVLSRVAMFLGRRADELLQQHALAELPAARRREAREEIEAIAPAPRAELEKGRRQTRGRRPGRRSMYETTAARTNCKQNIRLRRDAMHLTQFDIAVLTNITLPQVLRWEKMDGDGTPDVQSSEALCRVFGCDIDDLSEAPPATSEMPTRTAIPFKLYLPTKYTESGQEHTASEELLDAAQVAEDALNEAYRNASSTPFVCTLPVVLTRDQLRDLEAEVVAAATRIHGRAQTPTRLGDKAATTNAALGQEMLRGRTNSNPKKPGGRAAR